MAQLATLSGETLKVAKDTVTKVNGVETRKIDLTSAGLAQDVKLLVLLGGILTVIGLLIGFVGKNWGLAGGLIVSGLITAIGTIVVQALMPAIIWSASIALVIGAAYEIYRNWHNIFAGGVSIMAWVSTIPGKLFPLKKPTTPTTPPTTPAA